MTIYWWSQQGRMGNLLFQYATLCEVSRNSIILCFNDETFNFLNFNTAKNRLIKIGWIGIRSHKIYRKFLYLINFGIDAMAAIRLISSITPEIIQINGFESESRTLKKRLGLIWFFIVFKGFFQSDEYLKKHLLIKSEAYIGVIPSLDLISFGKIRIAVHVRLTDYRSWSVLGVKDLTIDIYWYKKAMQYMVESFPGCDFIIFSDDVNLAKILFIDFEEICFYQGGNAINNLLAMSLCDHFIISPSSYAYMGAFFGRNIDKVVLAPKHWLGFKSGVWYPAGIENQDFKYLEVD
jgi:hypothetical protein